MNSFILYNYDVPLIFYNPLNTFILNNSILHTNGVFPREAALLKYIMFCSST